ncbi:MULTISPECIES: DUF5106 domain-containing protein [unclassified Sphingobacterium]|uniref:DUF5106 domain-containing protein n=1 Tax=unclassified Sphingobacterium TaxID=2609468 RepID=UPI0025E2E561|nr:MULTISPECIES: DUF5106 domain-containing protein [unclassified Sphingobacterium]
MKKLLFSLLYAGFIISCQSPNQAIHEQEEKDNDSLSTSIHGQEHKYYLAEHYWDDIPLSDSLSDIGLEGFKESLEDYLLLLQTFPPEIAKETMRGFLNRKIASSTLLMQVQDIIENYLYNPLSPLRNDKLYATFLEYKLAYPGIEDMYLVRTRYQLHIISRNNINQAAEDFTYITPKSGETSLFNIKSNYTLLYFYNPSCPFCEETTKKMIQSRILNEFKTVRQGLAILAICTEPSKKNWSSYIRSFPSDWINGYNDKISTQQRYDLRALPSLYLLDKDKKVLLKDATFSQIEYVLSDLKAQEAL